jgi:hypothetical protein
MVKFAIQFFDLIFKVIALKIIISISLNLTEEYKDIYMYVCVQIVFFYIIKLTFKNNFQ